MLKEKLAIEDVTILYAKANNPKKKKKFVYVAVSMPSAELITEPRTMLYAHSTSDEVHITTDGAFDLYIAKRKARPSKVMLFNTQKEMEEYLSIKGVIVC